MLRSPCCSGGGSGFGSHDHMAGHNMGSIALVPRVPAPSPGLHVARACVQAKHLHT